MSAAESVEPGKIFVGGLSWETTQAGLKSYFEKWGEVSDCVIMQDPITKRPRGFGFVTFKDATAVQAVVTQGPHMLDNKTIDPKPATQKSATPPGGGGGATGSGPVKKVFVGGIAHGTTEDDIRAYFQQYGTVTEIDLKYDKATQRMRGFGFVGFDSEDVVEKLCQTHFHQISGKTVEVKKAEPRYATASGQQYQQRGAMGGFNQTGSYGGGGGGYGRGGYGGYGGYQGYGYGGQQQQQYGNFGTAYNYGGQTAGSYPNYGNYYDRYNSGQQTATGADSRTDYSTGYNYGQQQMGSYPQDASGYGPTRTNYSTDTQGYSQQTGYNYDSSSYQSYGDTQGTTQYARGGGGGAAAGANQQRGYHPYSR